MGADEATVQVRYVVDDVEAAIAFYRDHLGFDLDMHPAPPFAMLSRGDLRLLLSAPNPVGGGGQPMADGTPQEPGGWNRFAVQVEDLDATVERLRDAGARFRNDIVTGVGVKQIILEDPSGNPVELIEPTIPEARLESPTPDTAGDDASQSQATALVARIADDIWNRGRLEVCEEVMAPDARYHGPHMPGGVGTRDTWKNAIAMYRAAFPDSHVTYEALHALGDTVVGRWSATGTHTGPLPGLEPTGGAISIDGITIYRVQDGKIVEAWEQLDMLGMWEQLGVLTLPGRGA